MKIFVFGSNLAGIHGAGSARHAYLNYGAKYGYGIGFQGQSYAIPTKDENFNVLPLSIIKEHIVQFLDFARSNPQYTFDVVSIGCGLAGYSPNDIAPMFQNRSSNVLITEEFKKVLHEGSN